MQHYSLIFAALSAFSLLVFFSSVRAHADRLRNCFLLALILTFLIMSAATAVTLQFVKILFICLTAAFMTLLLLSLVLMGSGIVMCLRESGRWRNALTVLIGLLLACGDLGMFALLRKTLFAPIADPAFCLVGSAGLIYSALLFGSFFLYILVLPLFSRLGSFHTILVHGCALIHGDQISRILAERLETAILLYRPNADRARIVVSGGQGDDETITEAAAMYGYLREKNIPDERIICEDRSHSTEENLLYSMKLLPASYRSRIALVTSNYHLFRCLLQARELGIVCSGFGAPVAAYYWPNAALREFAAVFSKKRYLFSALLGFFLFTGLLIGAYHIFAL